MKSTEHLKTAFTMVIVLAMSSAAIAQTNSAMHDMRRLGGSTSFYKPQLTNVASLKRMGTNPKIAADLRTVLANAGLSELGDEVVATLANANSSVMGGTCSDATPADGTVVECDVQPGQTLQWMAYRPRPTGAPGMLTGMRWAGAKPFRAFLFRVTKNGKINTFLVPKACGNLSLMGVTDVPRTIVAVPPPAPPPPPPAPVVVPPPPPPPPAVVAAAPAAEIIPPATPLAVKGTPFFFDALFGKDRRVRAVDGSSTLEYSQCSPLVGLKVGVAKRFQNDWELAGAVGVALMMVGDDKVKENEVFVDVEANKYMHNGTFVGTGLSLWDISHSDTFTPAWMIHAGLPLGKSKRFPTYFMVEGRLFFDHLDDIDNNYQFWGGVRVHF